MATSLNVEKCLISKIIQDKSLKEVGDVQPFFFTDPDIRRAFEDVRNHYSEFGKVPTLREFKTDHPNIQLVEVDETWGSLVKRIQNQYIMGVLNENLDRVADAMEAGKVDDALNFLGMTLTKAHTSVKKSREVDVTENGHERLERYLERRANPGKMLGAPTGFPTLDKSTLGFQPGQLITIAGLAKASKSTIAMLMAMAMQEKGFKVLYCTYEMTVEEQERRLDAYRAGFNDNKLNSGNFTDEELHKLKMGIEKTASLEKMIINQDCMTISALNAVVDTFDPDVVIVDGVYLMDDEFGEPPQSPGALTNLVKGLHNLAMHKHKVVLAVTQATPARTKGETLNFDSIMGSRSFAQFSYCVIGIERTEDVGVRRLRILLGRSYAPCDVMIKFDYDTGDFGEIEDWDRDLEMEMELSDGTQEFAFAG